MNVRRRFAARLAAAAACALAAALAAFVARAEPGAGAEPASQPAARLPSSAAGAFATDGLPAFPATVSGTQSLAAPGESRSVAEGAASSDPAGFLKELLEAGQDEPEFLHPDVAFRLEAAAKGSDRAVIRWRIEPGYYLYAKRMEVHLPEGSPPGTAIATVDLARGEIQEDPYFGLVEV